MRHAEHEILEKVLEVLEQVVDLLERIEARLFPPQSTTGTIGVDMPLEVGGTTTATLTFQDANGQPAAPPKGDGSGLNVVFSSDNEAVATVGAATDSGDTATAEVTGVSPGSYTLSAVVSNTSGAALVDDDGTTAFVQPSSVPETVTAPPPPQAVTGVITVA